MTENAGSRQRRAVQIRWTPRLIVGVVLTLLAMVFALQNLNYVDVDILFWDFRMRLVWALAIFAIIGVILGWMLPKVRSVTRR